MNMAYLLHVKNYYKEAKAYVEFLEKELGHEIQFVSTGAEREKFVLKGEWL